MAARRIDLPASRQPVHALPAAPATYPDVVAAAELLGRATAAGERALADLAAAEEQLAGYQSRAAEDILDELAAASVPAEDAETPFRVAVEAARRRHVATVAACRLARQRHDEALTAARREFSTALQPLLIASLEAVRGLLVPAIEANERLRELATFGREHDPSAPPPYELAYPIPGLARLHDLDRGREDMLSPTLAELPRGRVLVEWLSNVMPFAKGERCALPEDEAIVHAKALNAVVVDPAEAKRLRVANVPQFTRPQLVRFTKDYAHQTGIFSITGSEQVLDPLTASRVVNLGFGVSLGDADE